MSTPVTVTLTPSEWEDVLYALRFVNPREGEGADVFDALADHVEQQTQA